MIVRVDWKLRPADRIRGELTKRPTSLADEGSVACMVTVWLRPRPHEHIIMLKPCQCIAKGRQHIPAARMASLIKIISNGNWTRSKKHIPRNMHLGRNNGIKSNVRCRNCPDFLVACSRIMYEAASAPCHTSAKV